MKKVNELQQSSKIISDEGIAAIERLTSEIIRIGNDPEFIKRRDQYLKDHPKPTNWKFNPDPAAHIYSIRAYARVIHAYRLTR